MYESINNGKTLLKQKEQLSTLFDILFQTFRFVEFRSLYLIS